MADNNVPPPDGAIDRVMTNILGRSWRTSLTGVATLACSMVVVADMVIHHPGLRVAAQVCTALGFTSAGAGLLRAKDAQVSGPQSK